MDLAFALWTWHLPSTGGASRSMPGQDSGRRSPSRESTVPGAQEEEAAAAAGVVAHWLTESRDGAHWLPACASIVLAAVFYLLVRESAWNCG